MSFTIQGSQPIQFIYSDDLSRLDKDYRGENFGFIYVDELGHITEAIYDFLLTLNRTAGNEPVQFISTANPDGVGYTWIREAFMQYVINNEVEKTDYKNQLIKDFTLKLNKKTREGEALTENIRILNSTVDDNPFLKNNLSYIAHLEGLEFNQMLRERYGLWNTAKYRFFENFSIDDNIIQSIDIDLTKFSDIYMSMDYGGKDPHCVLFCVKDDVNVYVFDEIYLANVDIFHIRNVIKIKLNSYNSTSNIIFCPHDMYKENTIMIHGANSRTSFIPPINYLKEVGFNPVRASFKREPGWNKINTMLSNNTEYRKLKITTNCKNLIKQLSTTLTHKTNTNEIRSNCEDHAIDALRYMVTMIDAVNESRKVFKLEEIRRTPAQTKKHLNGVYNLIQLNLRR